MEGERQSWAEFKVEKTVISVLTVFLSRSFLCLITQIIETQRAFWLPQVADYIMLLEVCVASRPRERPRVERRPGGKLGNFVALH